MKICVPIFKSVGCGLGINGSSWESCGSALASVEADGRISSHTDNLMIAQSIGILDALRISHKFHKNLNGHSEFFATEVVNQG